MMDRQQETARLLADIASIWYRYIDIFPFQIHGQEIIDRLQEVEEFIFDEYDRTNEICNKQST